jgi:acetyltransferase-like isoleucine patch superfamily enzyme
LPFQDGLLDRWERARRLGFDADASIYNSAIVLGTVAVGASTWIGPSTLLDGSGGGISIGRFCSISAGVHIYTHDTVAWSLSLGIAPRNEGAVAIGDGCYVGPQSVIAPGVTIGQQVVVGANSFVNRPVSDRTVVAGTPARPIGTVEVDGAEVRHVYDDRDTPS